MRPEPVQSKRLRSLGWRAGRSSRSGRGCGGRRGAGRFACGFTCLFAHFLCGRLGWRSCFDLGRHGRYRGGGWCCCGSHCRCHDAFGFVHRCGGRIGGSALRFLLHRGHRGQRRHSRRGGNGHLREGCCSHEARNQCEEELVHFESLKLNGTQNVLSCIFNVNAMD
jgi:hypothetical protein